MRRHLPFLTCFLLPCAAAEKVTYDDHVFPLLEQSCLNCHNPDKTKGGLDLSSYAGAMKGGSGGKIAEPGDTGSKLIAVVMQNSEPKMPPEGDKLADAQIDLLKSWIEGGLLENASSKARKPSKPKFDTAMAGDPTAKPDGPPPMPEHVLLEPEIVTAHPSAIHAMAASPWAPLLAVTGQRQVLLFDTGTLELAGVLPFPEGDPVSLAFTPTGRYLVVGGGVPGRSGFTITFDVTTGERMLTAGKEFDTILACDLRPDLSTVATGSPSRKIKIWNTADGAQLASIKKHTDWVTALDFSPDGVLLATGDRNGGVWVWEAMSGNEFHTLRAHQAGITTTAFRADSNVLATASEDGTVRFWEMSNGGEIRKIDAHPGGVLGFAWARDGSFATCGRDGKAKLWKPDFGHRRDLEGFPEMAIAVALDADGKRVFVATFGGQVVVHDVESGQRIGEFDSNPPAIETRLASLREKIDHHPQAVSAATAARDDAKRKLEEARKHLAESEQMVAGDKQSTQEAEQSLTQRLEEQAQNAGELESKQRERGELANRANQLSQQLDGLKAAPEDDATQLAAVETDLNDTRQQLGGMDEAIRALEAKRDALPATIDAARKAIDTSKARLSEHEKQLAGRSDALKSAETELTNRESQLAAVTGEIDVLHRQQRHWASAAINTRAIRTAKEAEAATIESESLAEAFSAAATALETAPSDDAANQLLDLRHQLDEALPAADRTRREAVALKDEYLRSLGN